MSVGKVALGVFLGNIATAIVAFIVIGMVAQQREADALHEQINSQYEAMRQGK